MSVSLRRNASWLLAGHAIYSASQWGLIIVLAQLGNSQMVGRFALAFAICAPIIMLTNLRLRFVLATDTSGATRFPLYLRLRVTTTVVALAAVAVLILVAGFEGRTAGVIALIGLAKAVEAISDIYYGYLQRVERMHLIAWSMMAKAVLSLSAFGVALVLTRDLLWASAALVGAWSTVLVLVDSPVNAKMRRIQVSRDHSTSPDVPVQLIELRRLALVAAPLGAIAFLASLSANVPKYFIQWHLGESDLGYFAAAAYLMVAGVTAMGAIGQSAMPRLANLYAQGSRVSFLRLVGRLLLTGALLGLLGVCAALMIGGQLLRILYGPAYAVYGNLLAWVMLAACLNYAALIMWYALTAMRKFTIQVPVFLGDVIVVTGTCALLVPRIGLVGAALGLVATMLYQLTLCGYLLRRYLPPQRSDLILDRV